MKFIQNHTNVDKPRSDAVHTLNFELK